MNVLLSVIVIVLAMLAIFINQWVSFLPQLGIGFQYRRRWVQAGIAAVTILTALGLYLNNSTTGQLIVLVGVLLLTPLSGFNHASKVLVPVDEPEHVAAPEAPWGDDEMVLGYIGEDQAACAWTLDTLIPHHLANDVVAGVPVLAGW